ncbi:hypothetical protein UY3_07525 [Chelonia mydas]|uniref:Uncharacterized protein n=1 Tax=Chelonia mydas TaxID=8469 RepID=M7BTF2_CHEMY|nr:hypothetical protein UY3_07525 [Chelonia mydas]
MPGMGTGCQAQPCQGSAPFLPISAGHEDFSGAPPEDGSGLAAVSPSLLRDELRHFLKDTRGSKGKVQLTLQRWGDFHHILWAVRALLGEGRGTGRQDIVAYQQARKFRNSLLTFGVEHGLLRGPLEAVDHPAQQWFSWSCPVLHSGVVIINSESSNASSGERSVQACLGPEWGASSTLVVFHPSELPGGPERGGFIDSQDLEQGFECESPTSTVSAFTTGRYRQFFWATKVLDTKRLASARILRKI